MMTGLVMRSAGLAGIHEGPGIVPPDGWYLVAYDPEAHDGRGSAEWAETPERALVFSSHIDLFEFWRRVPTTRPTRGDGKPNRPLCAVSVTSEPDPLGREGETHR